SCFETHRSLPYWCTQPSCVWRCDAPQHKAELAPLVPPQSKLRSIRPLERQNLARLLRRRHLISELLDQAARLRHLLGVAFGELAAADVQAVLETDAHVAAHHHRLRRERHLKAPG